MLAPLVWLSSLSFLIFGTLCLNAPYIVAEFERYSMPGVRTLTGVLQILAAAGLLIGLWVPKLGLLGALAAAGLALQMLVGLGVRIRKRSSQTLRIPRLMMIWQVIRKAFIRLLQEFRWRNPNETIEQAINVENAPRGFLRDTPQFIGSSCMSTSAIH